MQIMRLVRPGYVDKMIAFDELPERLVKGIRYVSLEGLPRHWKETAIHISETKVDSFSKQTITRQADVHYEIQFDSLTADIDRWKEIGLFCKKACDLNQRLTDKLEDMAIAMAPDAYGPVAIEPEEIPVIQIPIQYQEKSIPTPEVVPESAPILAEVVNPVPPVPVEIPPLEGPKVEGIQVAAQQEIVEIKAISAPNAVTETAIEPIKAEITGLECEVCGRKFADGRGMFTHRRSHNKIKVVA